MDRIRNGVVARTAIDPAQFVTGGIFKDCRNCNRQ
jgi:hypothetical protein